jgi:hypothetical protein
VVVVVVVFGGTVLAGELEHPARRTASARVAMAAGRRARRTAVDERTPTFMPRTLTEPSRGFREPVGDLQVSVG